MKINMIITMHEKSIGISGMSGVEPYNYSENRKKSKGLTPYKYNVTPGISDSGLERQWVSNPDGSFSILEDNKNIGNVDASGQSVLSNKDQTGSGLTATDAIAGFNALTGGYNAYLANKNYKLADKTLGANVAFKNRDLLNQGLAYNTSLDQQTKNAARLGGLDPEQTAKKLEENKAKYMNTQAISV